MAVRNEEPGEDKGPAWRDVWLLMKELETEYRGRCAVELSAASYGVAVGTVELRMMRVRGRNDWYSVASVGGRWPTTTSRTMPALLMRLLWQLEDEIAAYEVRQVVAENFPEGVLPPPPQP